MSYRECIEDAVDCALECKDELDLDLCKVSMVTRFWSGETVGRGKAKDEVCEVYPNPSVITFNHDLRLKEGGHVKSGDILIKSISRKRYPLESDVDGSVGDESCEKFYLICDKLYTVISVEKKIATWEVLVRRLSDQTRYE